MTKTGHPVNANVLLMFEQKKLPNEFWFYTSIVYLNFKTTEFPSLLSTDLTNYFITYARISYLALIGFIV